MEYPASGGSALVVSGNKRAESQTMGPLPPRELRLNLKNGQNVFNLSTRVRGVVNAIKPDRLGAKNEGIV